MLSRNPAIVSKPPALPSWNWMTSAMPPVVMLSLPVPTTKVGVAQASGHGVAAAAARER